MTKTSTKNDTNNTKPKDTKVFKACMTIVNAALTAHKVTVQSVRELEVRLNEAALSAVKYCQTTGDTRPAMRLVKGMMENPHPLTKGLLPEIVAYIKANSPIRFDTKGEPTLLKEGQAGYTPFKIEEAETKAFYERPEAQKARAIGAAAAAKALGTLTVKDILAKGNGLSKMVTDAEKPNAEGKVRGIDEKSKATILNMVTAAEKAAMEALVKAA